MRFSNDSVNTKNYLLVYYFNNNNNNTEIERKKTKMSAHTVDQISDI